MGRASSLETSRLRSGRALSHLICLKMALLLAGHLVQMTCKGPCQAKPGEDSAAFACEKQRDRRLLEGGPTRKPLPRAALSPAAASHPPAAAPGQTSAAPRPPPGCTPGSPAAEPTGAWAPAAAGSRSAGSDSEPARKANTSEKALPASFTPTSAHSDPGFSAPVSGDSFLPGRDAAQSSFFYANQKSQTLLQPQPFLHPDDLALRANVIG